MIRGLITLAVVGAVLGVGSAPAVAGAGMQTADSSEGPVEFTDDYLQDPENLLVGKEIWQEQCRHCHGKAAYPGKAPKLKPRRYKPDFVFDRVTNGFRKMPAWGEIFSQSERMSIVAYVLSKEFSP
jgi:mono/diheme cytochrome c family protein